MSKVIESLRASAREFTKKKSDIESGATPYEMTQEQLAQIYFSGGQKEKRSEMPLVIRVVEKPSASNWLPWVLALIAIAMAGFSLFSTKRIFVDIKVIDDKFDAQEVRGQTAHLTTRSSSADTRPNALSLQAASFEGAAKLKSAKNGSELILVNSSIASFARASLSFPEPIDLAGSKLVFYAKGQKGGERLAIAMKDRDNIQGFRQGEFHPFPAGLSNDWQRVEVPLTETAEGFDAKKVAGLRFEFGTKSTENKPGDTLFIKDLQVLPV